MACSRSRVVLGARGRTVPRAPTYRGGARGHGRATPCRGTVRARFGHGGTVRVVVVVFAVWAQRVVALCLAVCLDAHVPLGDEVFERNVLRVVLAADSTADRV